MASAAAFMAADTTPTRPKLQSAKIFSCIQDFELPKEGKAESTAR